MRFADSSGPSFVGLPTGEMRGLVHGKDWGSTPLGARHGWSKSLSLAVDIILASGFPMALCWGPDFIMLYNDGYRSLLGDKHPDALGLPSREALSEVWHHFEPIHQDILRGQREAALAEDVTLRIRRQQDGWEDARFTLSCSPTPDELAENGIGGIFVTAIETTAQAAAKAALRDTQAELRRLNETLAQEVLERTRAYDRVWTHARDLLVVTTAEGALRAVNPAWTRVLGHPVDATLGRSLLDFVVSADVPAAQRQLARAAAGGEPMDFASRLRHQDGSERWIDWHVAAEAGLIYAYGRDVSGEKAAAAKLDTMQQALRQAQKIQAIGQLTGGIAHDFNNTLAIIMGSLDMARRRLARGDAGTERYLDNAYGGAQRGATLTQRLLAFSCQSPLSPQVTDLNALVTRMAELLRRTLGDRVFLDCALFGGLWQTHVDPNQLESAIINLAVNARDAMPKGGKLTVETANVYLDEHYVAQEVGVAPGQYAMVAVTDSGTGIAADLLPRVFDPFFTSKPVGKGSGLGLSMVYGFVRQSRGHVRVYSEPGRGTTVKIYLPRHLGGAATDATVDAPQSLPRASAQGETVLLVEDEPRVRRMSREVLQELGYAVHEAASGEEALRMFDQLGHVDALFTDVVMGGMSGRELAEALRARAPALKVLYTTGYTRNAVVHNGVLDPGVTFLPKPFTVEELALKLRAVLDS